MDANLSRRRSVAIVWLVTALIACAPTVLAADALTPWSFVADLPEFVDYPAVATDGTFLYVAGGYAASSPGCNNCPVNTFERYDPSTNSWMQLAPMVQGPLQRLALRKPTAALGPRLRPVDR